MSRKQLVSYGISDDRRLSYGFAWWRRMAGGTAKVDLSEGGALAIAGQTRRSVFGEVILVRCAPLPAVPFFLDGRAAMIVDAGNDVMRRREKVLDELRVSSLTQQSG